MPLKSIVADASPLIFLAKIDGLSLLSDYRLYVPIQVDEEIQKGRDKHRKDSLAISRFFKNPNVSIVKTEIMAALPDYLGMGEKAVISYAANAKIKDVLIDEGKARAVARIYNLKPKGTLGVLNDAFTKGAITAQQLEKMVFDLVQKGYRIKEEILIEFLKKIKDLSG